MLLSLVLGLVDLTQALKFPINSPYSDANLGPGNRIRYVKVDGLYESDYGCFILYGTADAKSLYATIMKDTKGSRISFMCGDPRPQSLSEFKFDKRYTGPFYMECPSDHYAYIENDWEQEKQWRELDTWLQENEPDNPAAFPPIHFMWNRRFKGYCFPNGSDPPGQIRDWALDNFVPSQIPLTDHEKSAFLWPERTYPANPRTTADRNRNGESSRPVEDAIGTRNFELPQDPDFEHLGFYLTFELKPVKDSHKEL